MDIKRKRTAARKNVVLIGMPGVGKTTVGRHLAAQCNMGFLDTDDMIQTLEGKTLQEILDTRGREAFLQLEGQYGQAVAVERHVISTGGSMVYCREAMRHLATEALVVHLDLPPALLEKRLTNLSTRGTIMAPGQTIWELYEERTPLYRQYANETLDCSDLSSASILEAIRRFMQEAGLQ